MFAFCPFAAYANRKFVIGGEIAHVNLRQNPPISKPCREFSVFNGRRIIEAVCGRPSCHDERVTATAVAARQTIREIGQ